MKRRIAVSVLAALAVIIITASAPLEAAAQAAASSCITLTSDMRYRSTDESTNGQVTLLQTFLKQQGYFKDDPTGYFGLATLSAVRGFQNSMQLGGTGFVGAFTRAKIATLTCGNTSIPVSTPVTPKSLNVSSGSHIVVMDFEPWFGPNAIMFQNTYAKPLYTSASMASVGGGYDSADPAIIKQQVKLIQNLGADALLSDFSNAVGCIFTSADLCPGATAAERNTQSNVGGLAWKNNHIALYQTLSQLNKNGNSNLKIIPLLGAQSNEDFVVGPNGKNGVQNETDFFLNLQKQYPELSVIYQGKPLIVYYHGASQGGRGSWWDKTDQALAGYANQITYRHMGGFFDDQPTNRVNTSNLSSILLDASHPTNGFWTWIDRYNPSVGYYPSYNSGPNGTVEAFTAAYAAMGKTVCSGIGCWGSPPSNYAPDDTLANNGQAFQRYMQAASTLKPTFLLINQWNEYVTGDQGFDANTRNDIEPDTLVGYSNYNVASAAIKNYKAQFGLSITPFVDNSVPTPVPVSPPIPAPIPTPTPQPSPTSSTSTTPTPTPTPQPYYHPYYSPTPSPSSCRYCQAANVLSAMNNLLIQADTVNQTAEIRNVLNFLLGNLQKVLNGF